jgi:hypothetical protein
MNRELTKLIMSTPGILLRGQELFQDDSSRPCSGASPTHHRGARRNQREHYSFYLPSGPGPPIREGPLVVGRDGLIGRELDGILSVAVSLLGTIGLRNLRSRGCHFFRLFIPCKLDVWQLLADGGPPSPRG